MKKILSVIVISLALLLFTAPAGKTKVESYYSGDAVYYNNQLIIGSINSESLELFVEGDSIVEKITRLKPLDGQFGQDVDFSALKFSEEFGRLYVYLTADYSIYKYDVSNPYEPILVNKERNTYWEWYNGVDKINGEVVTISNKSVGILNTSLQNINAYDHPSDNAYNLSLDESSLFIVNNSNNYIEVYNRFDRGITASWAVNYKLENVNGNHRVYPDPLRNELFVIDDYYVKKFSMDGQLKSSFRHLDYPGYDVVPSSDGSSIYVSNGVGVMKFTRDNLQLTDYRFTTSLVSPGAWAMGIEAVRTPSGEKLVVFNSTNILVLDADLHNYSYFVSTEESSELDVAENLFLVLSHSSESAGDTIVLIGGGYAAVEPLTINFADEITEITSDINGRFAKALTVPDLTSGLVDIKVTGQSSKLSYSISFEIE